MVSVRARRGSKLTSSEASHRGLRVLFLGLLMLGMGQSLFFAVLPPIGRSLGLSEMQTGFVFSLSAVAWVFFSPFWGRQSDIWGRRTVMVIGLLGFAISTLLISGVIFASIQNWLPAFLILPVLVITRAIFGIFGSGAMPAAQAYMADRTRRTKRAQGASMITASFGIGNIIGPGFAAGLVVFGFLTPFVFVGVMGIVAAVMILVLLPERYRGRFSKKRKEKINIFSPKLRPFMVMGILSSYAQAVLIQLSAFYFMDRLDLDSNDAIQMIGIGLTFMALAALFAQFMIIQKFEISVQRLLCYSGIAMALAFIGLALSDSYVVMVLFLGLAGLGFGMMRPGLMAATSLAVGKNDQGSAAGMINATAAVGHAINPFTGAVLYSYYAPAPFLLSALCMLWFLLMAYQHPQIKALGKKSLEDDSSVPAPHLAVSISAPQIAKSSSKKTKQKG